MKSLAILAAIPVLALTLPAAAQQTTQESQQQPAEIAQFKTMAEMSPEEKKAWEQQSIQNHRDAFFKRIAERMLQQQKEGE